MFAACDDSGIWWYTEASEGKSFEEAVRNLRSKQLQQRNLVLVLNSVLHSFLPALSKENKEFMSPINDTAPLGEQTWEIEELYDFDWSLVTIF